MLHTQKTFNDQLNLFNNANKDPLTRNLAVLREEKKKQMIKHSGLRSMQSSASTTRMEMARSKSENCPKT